MLGPAPHHANNSPVQFSAAHITRYHKTNNLRQLSNKSFMEFKYIACRRTVRYETRYHRGCGHRAAMAASCNDIHFEVTNIGRFIGQTEMLDPNSREAKYILTPF